MKVEEAKFSEAIKLLQPEDFEFDENGRLCVKNDRFREALKEMVQGGNVNQSGN